LKPAAVRKRFMAAGTAFQSSKIQKWLLTKIQWLGNVTDSNVIAAVKFIF
jgi:hypothetical protein